MTDRLRRKILKTGAPATVMATPARVRSRPEEEVALVYLRACPVSVAADRRRA
jgi:hypothetical protein